MKKHSTLGKMNKEERDIFDKSVEEGFFNYDELRETALTLLESKWCSDDNRYFNFVCNFARITGKTPKEIDSIIVEMASFSEGEKNELIKRVDKS